jgi:hypothetical protein
MTHAKRLEWVPKLVGIGLLLGVAPGSWAANPVVPIPGRQLDAALGLEQNLTGLVGQSIQIVLDSGVQLGGRVKTVGQGFLHLEALTGKGFMDALVRLERIQALELQVRAYENDLPRFQP